MTASDSTFPQMQEAASMLARAAEILARLASRRPPPPTPAPAAPPPTSPSMYLTTREAAALLGVSVKGLEAMRARGAGPKYVRVGNRVRYLASELPGVRK